MKLLKTDNPYLTKDQWRRIFLAMSIMTIVLYVTAMVFSLCGSKYFILNYQNEQMDRIENFLREHNIMALLNWCFTTLEFVIISSFILRKLSKWYYILAFYGIAMFIAGVIHAPTIFYQIYPFAFYIIVPVLDQLIENRFKHFSFKVFSIHMLRLLIAMAVVFVLQVLIFIIKTGDLSFKSIVQPLATAFIYAIEYDIALSVILLTIELLLDKEKGDSESWTTYHNAGLSSQTSKIKLQKLKLTKTQKNKLRFLYIRFYLTQLGAFLLLMVLPFLLGKIFEFLVMYLAFVIARYILGFKYSLHYKKETLCITVGAVVFGILALTVPFFYIVVIIAILLGVGLAVLLHLSYKYKGFYMFNKICKPDKFAELYVLMDGDLTPHHVKIICYHRGLDTDQTNLMLDFAEGNKKSYLAKKYGYSEKSIERKINEALDLLNKKA